MVLSLLACKDNVLYAFAMVSAPASIKDAILSVEVNVSFKVYNFLNWNPFSKPALWLCTSLVTWRGFACDRRCFCLFHETSTTFKDFFPKVTSSQSSWFATFFLIPWRNRVWVICGIPKLRFLKLVTAEDSPFLLCPWHIKMHCKV